MFRKIHSFVRIAPPESIIQIQSQSYDEEYNGHVITRVAKVPVDLCSKEMAATLPTYKEYYLEELIKAGVPLDQLNVSNYFGVQDSENLKAARTAALARIQDKLIVESQNSVE